MIVPCSTCGAKFDDEYRFTFCPHDTFAANDGKNNFAHHPESALVEPRMYYFGPWDHSGHFFFDERGNSINEERIPGFPFGHYTGKVAVDGCLQPGCPEPDDRLRRKTRPEVEGEALLHHIQGWTALCFWDRSVDKRGACNSNYFADGTFTFEQMVQMSKIRFAHRWNKMTFEVVDATSTTS